MCEEDLVRGCCGFVSRKDEAWRDYMQVNTLAIETIALSKSIAREAVWAEEVLLLSKVINRQG
jgi:hypothetical protein